MVCAFVGVSPWVAGLSLNSRRGPRLDARRRGRTDRGHGGPAGAKVGLAASASAEWGGLSMDTLDSFTEVAWRAQEQICEDTAAFDGLGTYEHVADAACAPRNDPRGAARRRDQRNESTPSSRRPHRAMAGGRAFAAAYVDVFDSRGVVIPRGSGNRRTSALETEGSDKDSGNEKNSNRSSSVSDNARPSHNDQRHDHARRKGHDTTRSRILTRLHKHTGSVSHKTDGAGLSVRLVPRNPAMPALNATAYFFQAGDANVGTWWFAGSADLCRPEGMSPNEFFHDFSVFLAAFDKGLAEHRRQHRRHVQGAQMTYLEKCLVRGMHGVWDGSDAGVNGDASGAGSVVPKGSVGPARPIGGASSSSSSPSSSSLSSTRRSAGSSPRSPPRPLSVSLEPGLDQTTGFAFVSSIVEQMMPAYLPLVTRGSGGRLGSRAGPGGEAERRERIALAGGALLDATTLRSAPYGLWRFSVQPAALSPAGRYYELLRRDATLSAGAGCVPCVYL